MKKQLMTLYFLLVIIISGIAQTDEPLKLNGSSDEELNASMQKIVATMDKEEKDKFVDAFMFVVMGKAFTKDVEQEEILEYLDGKTADELIKDVKEKKTVKAKLDYEELKKKKVAAEKHKETLSKIKVSNYELKKVEKFGEFVPALNATIVNKTNEDLYLVYFRIMDKNGNNEDNYYEVSHRISEKLKPGQSVTFTEALNKFEGDVDEFLNGKENLILKVAEVKDEKWKTIYDIDYFSKKDEAELEKLENELNM